jgi:hypothetical protein|tara:strand:+ start:398 stop:802 length:405 start_codon:yes stop_codon:yes gene_type:complete
MKKDNPMKKVTLNCSICKEKIDEQITKNTNTVYWTEGHNAEPINAGRCCTECNNNVVIPIRLLGARLSRMEDMTNEVLKDVVKGTDADFIKEHGMDEASKHLANSSKKLDDIRKIAETLQPTLNDVFKKIDDKK